MNVKASSSDQPAMHEAPHVLLVDDDETALRSLEKIMRNAGFTVSVAQDFTAALAILETAAAVQLLIVDVVMPGGINGVALSRMARLRQRDLKVIYVTGYDVPGLSTEGYGPVLRKPVEPSIIIAEARRLLAS